MKQRLGLFLCLILALAACSGPLPEAVIEHEAITSVNTTALLADLPPAVPDLSSFPVTIENCGRTLTFTQPPERVVGLWQPVNETLLALGVQDRIIGFAGMYDSLPAEFDEAAQEIPKLGKITTLYFPTKEVMIEAQPDLVVAEGLDNFAYDAAQGFATVAELEASGANVYSSGAICRFTSDDSERRGLDSVYTDLENLGKIFGVSARADAIIARLKEREVAIETAVATAEPVRVAFFNGDDKAIYVLNTGIWSDLMAKAGGDNVFEGIATDGEMSVEFFSVIDADVILYGTYPRNGFFPGRDPAEIETYLSETFPEIPAVSNGRLSPIPTVVTEAGIRALDGLEMIAKALHPDAFK
ncbi:MAG: ABC transporter substrate-binding protein [Anaerolineae bacterium]|nr:ABC transporter substrate-binding protein [Anaerolineae bacterium]